MTAMVVGLREIDPRAVDVVRAYGGGEGAVHALGPAARAACRRCSAACGSRRPTPCSARSSPSSAAAAASGSASICSARSAGPTRRGCGASASPPRPSPGSAYCALRRCSASRVTEASRAVTIAAGAVPRARDGDAPAAARWRSSSPRCSLPFAAVVAAALALLGAVADHRQDAARACSTTCSCRRPRASAQEQAARGAGRRRCRSPCSAWRRAWRVAFLLAVLGAVRPALVRALHAGGAGHARPCRWWR